MEQALMAANDASLDQIFQEWDDQRIRLHAAAIDQQAQKLGPYAKLIGQRLHLFAERWRPERMKVMKRLGNQNNASPDTVRGTLTPLARDEFIADLRTWGVPDRYAHAAGSLIQVR